MDVGGFGLGCVSVVVGCLGVRSSVVGPVHVGDDVVAYQVDAVLLEYVYQLALVKVGCCVDVCLGQVLVLVGEDVGDRIELLSEVDVLRIGGRTSLLSLSSRSGSRLLGDTASFSAMSSSRTATMLVWEGKMLRSSVLAWSLTVLESMRQGWCSPSMPALGGGRQPVRCQWTLGLPALVGRGR